MASSSDEEGEDMGSEEEEMLLTDEEGEVQKEMEEAFLDGISAGFVKPFLKLVPVKLGARRSCRMQSVQKLPHLKTEMAETNLFLPKLERSRNKFPCERSDLRPQG
jgi:hypothetical protein